MSDAKNIYVYFDHNTTTPELLGVLSVQIVRGTIAGSFLFVKIQDCKIIFLITLLKFFYKADGFFLTNHGYYATVNNTE